MILYSAETTKPKDSDDILKGVKDKINYLPENRSLKDYFAIIMANIQSI